MSSTPVGSCQAPVVPNMIPTWNGPIPLHTPIDLLKDELGEDVHLLDYIPINKVDLLLYNTALDGFLPHGIPVATVIDENGEQWAAWALMSSSVRNSSVRRYGLPDIWFFAINASSGAIKQEKLESVIQKGELREEFRPQRHKNHGLIALLKVILSTLAL